MENKTKLALFVGGKADKTTREINQVEPRLHVELVTYISRGILETKEFGVVQIYVLEGMKADEEARRIKNL